MFSDKKLSKLLEFYYLQSGLYPSITDNFEAMTTLIQQRHKHTENCITAEVSRRTQEYEVSPASENLVLHTLVRIWDTFSEVMLLMSLEKC